jgi:Holliday junction resolvase RusA-like endonuclease
MYTPEKTAKWESGAGLFMHHAWKGEPLVGVPVYIICDIVIQRPKALQGKKHPEGRMPCQSKPDADNALKAAMDALVLGGVLADDKCVVGGQFTKLYSSKSEAPHMRVRLFTWSDVSDTIMKSL